MADFIAVGLSEGDIAWKNGWRHVQAASRNSRSPALAPLF